jgi:hypothetical protein
MYPALELLQPGAARERLAMVLPLWYPPSLSQARADATLALNLCGVDLYVAPERVYLVVDGNEPALRAVAALQRARRAEGLPSLREVVSAENRGKAGALALGYRAILEESDARWVVVRDADGDHFLGDLPRLTAMAAQIEGETGPGPLAVVGARLDLRRPMGWLRGELEHWCNLLAMDATTLALGRVGRVFDRRFLLPGREAPDINSGYKLYSRAVVEETLMHWEALPGGDETRRRLRNTMEIDPFLSAALSGTVGEVLRGGLIDQTLTSFPPETYEPMFRSIATETARRCGIPPPQAPTWLVSAAVRCGLWSDGAGRALVERISGQVLGDLGAASTPLSAGPAFY